MSQSDTGLPSTHELANLPGIPVVAQGYITSFGLLSPLLHLYNWSMSYKKQS